MQGITPSQKYGFIPQKYGSDLAFLLSEPLKLKEMIATFDGIPIDSISHQPVHLEHIYV